MNFYTGLILGLLAIKKIKGNKETINFNESFTINSYSKGRIRIRSIELKNKEKGDLLTGNLMKIDGIKKVAINNITGSILIEFNEEKIDPDLLVPAISRLLELEAASQKEITLQKETTLVYNSLNYAVANKTNNFMDIDSFLPIVLLALAIYQYYKTRGLGLPSAITLLYWAYTLINTEKVRL